MSPNPANVAALAKLIQRTGLAPQHDPWAMAMYLAADGCLVPSALTPAQMAEIGDTIEREMAGSGATDPEAYAVCVDLLTRLARGDAGA